MVAKYSTKAGKYNLIKTIIFELFFHFYHLFWICCQIFPESTLGNKFRGLLLGSFLRKRGRNFQVSLGCKIVNPFRVTVGDNVYLGTDTWIFAGEKITIRDEVLIGPKNVIVSSDHTYLNGSPRFSPSKQHPIVIGFGCWIAANCTITAGSVIGDSVIVAAGSVVKGSIDGNCIVAGSPACKIKDNI